MSWCDCTQNDKSCHLHGENTNLFTPKKDIKIMIGDAKLIMNGKLWRAYFKTKSLAKLANLSIIKIGNINYIINYYGNEMIKDD